MVACSAQDFRASRWFIPQKEYEQVFSNFRQAIFGYNKLLEDEKNLTKRRPSGLAQFIPE